MPKSGPERAANYANKIDADVIKTRITARRDTMITAQQDRQSALATLYAQIRGLLDTANIAPIFNAAYTAFGNQLYGMQRRFGEGSTVFETEAGYAKTTWVARGLNTDICHDIALLFGMSI